MVKQKAMPLIKPASLDFRHSDNMSEIIKAVPSWILKWGTTLFFCILLLLFSFSAIIKYPDVIKTQLRITTAKVPKAIIPKVSGKIVKATICTIS